jgi:hypothetical protein
MISDNGPSREMNEMDRLQRQINLWAESKGWNQNLSDRSFGDWCALITSEISEAYEDYRNHRGLTELYFEDALGKKYSLNEYHDLQRAEPNVVHNFKPCGIPIEFADAMIRMLHLADFLGFNMYNMIEMKMRYNETRSHRHGGKKV